MDGDSSAGNFENRSEVAQGGALNMTNKLWRNVLPTALVAAVAVGAAPAQAAPNAHQQLAAVATKKPNAKVTAIVQFKPSVGEKKAAKLVSKHGGKVTSRVPLIHGFAVKLPAKQAKLLANESSVVGLTLNTRVHSTGLDKSLLQ